MAAGSHEVTGAAIVVAALLVVIQAVSGSEFKIYKWDEGKKDWKVKKVSALEWVFDVPGWKYALQSQKEMIMDTLRPFAVPLGVVLMKIAWYEEEWRVDAVVLQCLTLGYLFSAMKMMRVMEKMEASLVEVQKKCTYIEGRMMLQAGSAGDFARQLLSLMQTYEPEKVIEGGEGLWMIRPMRTLFETRMKRVPTEEIQNLWRLLCTECAWRFCRDCLQERFDAAFEGVLQKNVDNSFKPLGVVDGELMEKACSNVRNVMEQQKRILRNMKMEIEYWSPIRKAEEWALKLETSKSKENPSAEQMVLISQLKERQVEMISIMHAANGMMKQPMEIMYEGLFSIVAEWAAQECSSSSGERRPVSVGGGIFVVEMT
jgi:hypothetical protein